MPSFLLAPRPLLIGVVHLLATPGAPRFAGDREAPLRRALQDARTLVDGGVDALIVENFGDVPFYKDDVPAESIATMALALDLVRRTAGELPVGVNVLRNDARAALGLCAATGAGFVRINVHCGAMLTDQGLIEGRAAATLRERDRLCPDVRILADVHVKHAVPLGGESITLAALDTAQRGLADAVIVSGTHTGSAPALDELTAVRDALGDHPLLIGSGLDRDNAPDLLRQADGAIVGTALKQGGRVEERVDPERLAVLRALFDQLRRA